MIKLLNTLVHEMTAHNVNNMFYCYAGSSASLTAAQLTMQLVKHITLDTWINTAVHSKEKENKFYTQISICSFSLIFLFCNVEMTVMTISRVKLWCNGNVTWSHIFSALHCYWKLLLMSHQCSPLHSVLIKSCQALLLTASLYCHRFQVNWQLHILQQLSI